MSLMTIWDDFDESSYEDEEQANMTQMTSGHYESYNGSLEENEIDIFIYLSHDELLST